MNNKELISSILALAFFAGLFFYAINIYKDIKNRELINNKIGVCGQIYRYTETQKNGTVISYPMKKEFEECVSSN